MQKKKGGKNRSKSKGRKGRNQDEEDDSQSQNMSQSVRSGGRGFGRTKGRKGRTGALSALIQINNKGAGKPKRENGRDKVNNFRDICASFQQIGLKVRKIKQETTASNKKSQDVMPKKKFHDRMKQLLREEMEQNPEMRGQIATTLDEFTVDNDLCQDELLHRYDFECAKLLQMQRAFIQMKKRMETKRITRLEDLFRNHYDIKILQPNSPDPQISGNEFCQMLERMGILQSGKTEDVKYMFDEYMQIANIEESKEEEEEESKEQFNRRDKKKKNTDEDRDEDAAGREKIVQKERENERKEEKQKELFKKATFSLNEIKKDYEYFQKEIIPETERTVLELVAKHCVEEGKDFTKMFFLQKVEEDSAAQAQSALMGDDRLEPGKQQYAKDVKFRSFVHISEMYQIINDIMNPEDEKDLDDKKDYRTLFSVYALKVANTQNNLIPVNYLWQAAQHPTIKDVESGKGMSRKLELFSKELIYMMLDDNENRLVRHLAKCVQMDHQKNSLDSWMAQGAQISVEKVVEILESDPYNTCSQTILTPALLKQVLQERFFDGAFANLDSLKGAVKKAINILQKRNDLLANLYKQLAERGLDYDQLFENIWGYLDVKTKKIDRSEVQDIFKSVKLRFTEDQLDAFMTTMSYENDDLVLVSDFKKEGERHTIGQRHKEKKQDSKAQKKKTMQQKKRYFGHDHIFRFVAETIVKQKLVNLGSSLKGQDFGDYRDSAGDTVEGYISRSNFFDTIWNNPHFNFHTNKEGLMEGDVMDMMNVLDSQKTGYIELDLIREKINEYIETADSQYNIRIPKVSIFQVVCEEEVVEQSTDQGKVIELMLLELQKAVDQKPSCIKAITVEAFSALSLDHSDKDLSDYLEYFSRKDSKHVSLDEFATAMYKLGIKIDRPQVKAIFKYLLAKYKSDDLERAQRSVRSGEKSNEEAGDLVIEIKNREHIDCQRIEDYLEQIFPLDKAQSDREKFVEFFNIEIVEKISYDYLPLNDIVDLFRLGNQNDIGAPEGVNPNNIPMNDFTDQILNYNFKVEDIMTAIKRELLADAYRSEQDPAYVDIDRFLNDLFSLDHQMRLQNPRSKRPELCTNEDEVEKRKFEQDQTAMPGKQAGQKPKKQVVMIDYVVRSTKNTYMTEEARAERGEAWLSPTDYVAGQMKDIMLRTRAYGKSVECYFQQFADVKGNELSKDKFYLALKALDLDWVDDRGLFEDAYRALDYDEQGHVSLDEIAQAVLDCVGREIIDYENDYLEKTFQLLKEKDKLSDLEPHILSLNTNRDFTCSVNDFVVNLFRQSFEIGDSEKELFTWQIQVIMQRYGIFGEHQTTAVKKGKMYDRYAKHLKVFFYGLISDLGSRSMGVEFKYIPYMHLAECITKRMKIQGVEDQNFGIYLSRFGNTRADIISDSEFVSACLSLGMDSEFTKKQMEMMLAKIGIPKGTVLLQVPPVQQQQQPGGYAHPFNTIDSGNTGQGAPQYQINYKLSSVQEVFKKLVKKSEAEMQTDTLNVVFIVSKRLEMYQKILTMFTEVDELDGSKDGYVKPREFVDIIKSTLKTNTINDCAQSKDFKLFKINSIDIEHLAFAYMMNIPKNGRGGKEEMEKVYYELFYKQYDELENKGLANKITGLNQDAFKKGKKNVESKDKFFDYKIPDKYLKFYGILSKEIERGGRKKQFFDAFLEQDRVRDGFLTNSEVHYCFNKVGIKLIKKQVAQITYPLHQKDGSYCWPELIELMFGKEEWINLKSRNNLTNMFSLTESETDFNEDSQISEKLQRQIEYKYAELLIRQIEETKGMNMLQEDQFIEIFEQVGISLTEQDKLALHSFFEQNKSMISMINIQELFDKYEMTNRLGVCKKQIQMFFTAKEERQLTANKHLLKKGRYDFKDIIEFLKKNQFELITITQKYILECQKDVPAPIPEDHVSNLTPKQYAIEFRDLYDIFLVNQEGGEDSFIKKANLMTLFAIEFREVEASDKEDTKRSGSARAGDSKRGQSSRRRVYEKKELDAQENKLRAHMEADKMRKTILAKVKEETLTMPQFEELLKTKLKFSLDVRDRFGILCQLFAAKQGKEGGPRLISVPLLKEKMGAKEEEEKRRPQSLSKKKAEKVPSKKSAPTKSTEEIISEAEMKQDPSEFNQKTKDILAAVNTFLKQNKKNDKEQLFKEMDKNNDGNVDSKEFVTYFTKMKQSNERKGKDQSEVDRALSPQSLQDLFLALDCDGSKSLDLGEFVKYIGYADELQGKIQENIDDDTFARIEQYISKLFRQVDRDKSGHVDLDELYNLLKPTNPGTFNKAKCQQIIERFDSNSDGVLDEEEFHKVVQCVISESLTNPHADFEDWKKRFRLLDKDKDGQLTVEEFKTMITENLKVKAINGSDIDTLVAWIDQDGDKKIPIGEFFELLANNAQINYEPNQDMVGSEQSENNLVVKKCLFAIRNAMSIDLFEYFSVQCANALPDFFEPSFLQNIIEKGGKNMPSQGLISLSEKPDKNKIDYTKTGTQPTFNLRENQTFQMNLQDIDNVPVPIESGNKDGKFELKDIHSREVRIVLFDKIMGQYISNTQIIPASGSKDGKKWTFDFSESIKLAKSFTFKCDWDNPKKDIELRFELVLTLKKKDQKDYQYTNGWGSLSVSELSNKSKGDIIQVKLTGGSPVNHAEINPSQVQAKNIKSKGFFGKKDTEDPNTFFLKLGIEPIQITKLDDLEKGCFYSLPFDFIINTSLVSFYSGIAAHCSQVKVESGEEASSCVLKEDVLLAGLHKYFDCTDLNVLMGSCWQQYYSPEKTKEYQETGSILGKISCNKRAMQAMVLEIYESIYEVDINFEIDPIYPTRSSKLSAEDFGAQENAFMKKMILNKISMTDDVAEKAKLSGIVDKIVKDLKPRKNGLKGVGEDFVCSGDTYQQFSMDNDLEEPVVDFNTLLQKHEGQVDIMK